MSDEQNKPRLSLEERLNKEFEITEKSKEIVQQEDNKEIKNLEDDYLYARKNLKNLNDTTIEAIEHLFEVAKDTDSPRAYEVLARLIETSRGNSTDLMKILKEKKDIESTENNKSQQNSINNSNIFVGSTKDLIDSIRNQENNNQKTIDHE